MSDGIRNAHQAQTRLLGNLLLGDLLLSRLPLRCRYVPLIP